MDTSLSIQEAIHATNAILNADGNPDTNDYFSPKQPGFFIEAARGIGRMELSAKDPDLSATFTGEECRQIAKEVQDNLADVDDTLKRDHETTANTTPETRVYIDGPGGLMPQVQQDYLAEHPDGTEAAGILDRPMFWGLCDDNGVTLYTERWEGRRDGRNFILPKDRQTMYDACMAKVKEYAANPW